MRVYLDKQTRNAKLEFVWEPRSIEIRKYADKFSFNDILKMLEERPEYYRNISYVDSSRIKFEFCDKKWYEEIHSIVEYTELLKELGLFDAETKTLAHIPDESIDPGDLVLCTDWETCSYYKKCKEFEEM